jgi:hypothetical protein
MGTPDAPEAPELPPEVEEVDVLGQEQYTKKRLQERQGRRSTILGSQSMGSSNKGGKTLLG